MHVASTGAGRDRDVAGVSMSPLIWWVLPAGVAALAIALVGGYALNWRWTGFQGNTLWDWLELLALPMVVASLPL